jgi:diguanylate cyclase (GGDEF)-like protein
MAELKELITYLQYAGKDPSRLIFEDELTGLYNRRFLFNYFQSKISWDAVEDHPVSLIMLDIDHFKQINDTYGHQVGDQALVWVAGLLKEVAGDEGIAIRYAGDEFINLLPSADKRTAIQDANRLLRRIQEERFRSEEFGVSLHLTLSMGIASAPKDARSGKTLIRKADTALYYAKKSGRDRLADAGEIALEDVFAKTAIYQLEEAKIVGRKEQLAHLSIALKAFSRRESQFVIVEGAAGMGKSEFLDVIRRNLSRSKIPQLKVNGTAQEQFRPYYLTTDILVALLNQREDKGAAIFNTMAPEEIACLAYIVPQIGGTEEPFPHKDEKAQRESIFTTLVHFIPKILDCHPLIVLIDDLHLVDEATLMLFRRLILSQEIPLFICGTSMGSRNVRGEAETAPLERFYWNYHQELGIRKLSLTPLTSADIAEHIQRIFPHVRLPETLDEDLTRTTQGNPLFLNEILRKLVLDQKITLVGRQWMIQPLEKGYLPRSLDEIVGQKIAALDKEGRKLLEQVSTLGENVPLSVLIGSSDQVEAKALEFIDQAAAQGLISTEFERNDETIRFLGKQVHEITYGTIQQDQRKRLHESVATYHETLYQQHLLPSAAPLAYHLRRSADQEKAKKYEQIQATWNQKIFNAREVTYYMGDRPTEFIPSDIPLDPAGLAMVPNVIRHLLGAARNIKLYPRGSTTITAGNRQLKESLDQILETNERLNIIVQIDRALIVNGQKIDVTDFKFVARSLIQFLNRLELKGIAFHRGMNESELDVLLEAFGRTKPEMIDQRFWQRFSEEHHLKYIDLKQVRYTMTGEAKGLVAQVKVPPRSRRAPALDRSPPLRPDEQTLDQDELKQIVEIIRSLIRAARTIKLYPLKSKAISSAVDQIMAALNTILPSWSVLALARVSDSLIVNGIRVDISGFETVARGFLKFLESIELSSITFLEDVTTGQLETFIGALGQIPSGDLDGKYWIRFAREHGLSGILFNQHLYEARVAPTMQNLQEGQIVDDLEAGELQAQETEPIPKEQFEAFLEEMPSRVNELLVEGDERNTSLTLGRLLQGIGSRDPLIRGKVIDTCRSLLESLTLALKHQFARILANSLLLAFSEEDDPKVLVEMVVLLHRMAAVFIQFAEYQLASRVFLSIQNRQQALDKAKEAYTDRLARVLDIRLEAATQKLLVEDLRSRDSSRQQHAAQLLGSLGKAAMPLLIDIIKQDEEYRVRKIAFTLLEDLGPQAAEALKRELMLEIAPEERSRILEDIYTVTRNLNTELSQALGDENPQVRRAAFRLAERLNDNEALDLLREYARHKEPEMATAAIKSLGRLKLPTVVSELLSILNSTKDADRLIACCRALGQISDPVSIEPLTKLLASKGALFARKRRSTQVRGAAAFALGQISHPRATEALTLYVNDPDPMIRKIAEAVLRNATPPPNPDTPH